jgi:hypothetical protein
MRSLSRSLDDEHAERFAGWFASVHPDGFNQSVEDEFVGEYLPPGIAFDFPGSDLELAIRTWIDTLDFRWQLDAWAAASMAIWDVLDERAESTAEHRLMLSATCFFPDRTVESELLDLGFTASRRATSPFGYSLPTSKLWAESAQELQVEFERELEQTRSMLRELGIDLLFAAEHDAFARVYVSLPKEPNAEADVIVTTDMLDLWHPLRASFRFDVL